MVPPPGSRQPPVQPGGALWNPTTWRMGYGSFHHIRRNQQGYDDEWHLRHGRRRRKPKDGFNYYAPGEFQDDLYGNPQYYDDPAIKPNYDKPGLTGPAKYYGRKGPRGNKPYYRPDHDDYNRMPSSGGHRPNNSYNKPNLTKPSHGYGRPYNHWVNTKRPYYGQHDNNNLTGPGKGYSGGYRGKRTKVCSWVYL